MQGHWFYPIAKYNKMMMNLELRQGLTLNKASATQGFPMAHFYCLSEKLPFKVLTQYGCWHENVTPPPPPPQCSLKKKTAIPM